MSKFKPHIIINGIDVEYEIDSIRNFNIAHDTNNNLGDTELNLTINENGKNGLKLKHYIINNYRHSNSINAILPLNDSKFIINECYITDLTFDMNEYYTITLKYYYINISPYSNSEIRRKKLKIIFNDDI